MILRTTWILLALSLFSFTSGFAQNYTVKGTVKDSVTQSPLPGANVVLIRAADSLLVGAAADVEGRFTLEKVQAGRYLLRISFLGYQLFEKRIFIRNQSLELGDIPLVMASTQLNEVQVMGKTPTVVQNGDTTQFNAKAFKTQPDATAEDLLQKMPGMDVSNGTVKAQGEDVARILVDGKPFFGDDASAALKNLPAEIIDQIQVYDQKSDQAQFTGFDDGQNSKTINIVTRADRRKGQFGKFYVGYGAGNKYQAGGNLNIFKNDRRISLIAQSNNINIQNFSSQDLVGISGSSGQGGRGGGGGRSGGQGGRGGGGQSGGSSTSNFMVGQQSGISTTHAAGLNYSDKWGKKVDVTGSYFFNRSNNNANQFSFRNYVLPADSGQTYQQNSLSSSTNYNQRLNFRLNYQIDSANSLLIRPSFSWQQNDGISSLSAQTKNVEEVLNQTSNDFSSQLTGYNFSNEALFRHRFSKPRRTFSLSLNTGYNRYRGESNLRAENNFYDGTVDADTVNQNSSLIKNGWNLSGNASYTEPLGKKSMLQLNYIVSWQRNNSNKETFNFSEETSRYSLLDTALTNRFESRYISQQVGSSYRYQAQKLNLSFGANYQVAQLKNDQLLPRTFDLSRTFYNLLPSAMLRYQFSNKQNLNINYRAATNQPSVDQLQNVINNANPIQLSTGNPDLKQTYQHNLTFRYTAANTERSRTSFASLSGSYATNYVVNSIFIAERDSVLNGGIDLKKGSQLSRPVNTDGYWTLRSFGTYGVPIKLLKSNLNLNASFNYTHSPGYINNQLNYSDAQTLGLGVVLSSNISEKLDFTLSSTSSFNRSQNTLQSKLNSRYFNQNSRLSLNWIFWKGFVYQTSLNHQVNSGLSNGYNQNFLLWNMSLGKKFLKNQQGELKLSVYDALKQNNSIQRNINVAYVEDVQTQVLQRYFMLTFTYNLRNFRK
jgi:uncharacterized membrane protein YgcG